MDANLRKETQSALDTVIRRVPSNQVFDSHTIIQIFANDPDLQDIYRRFCGEFGVTFADRTKLKRAHSELSKMIGKNPIVEPVLNEEHTQLDVFSHNINEGVNANKLWKFKGVKSKGESRKKLQSEE